MAGKFLTLDEAAAALGISAEDVQKLVDRKELFPIRDGGNLKFRTEEIERRQQDAMDDTSWEQTAVGDDATISLDLDAESLKPSAVTPEPAAAVPEADEPLILDDMMADDQPAGSAKTPQPSEEDSFGELLALDDLEVDAASTPAGDEGVKDETIELASDLNGGGESLLSSSADDFESVIGSAPVSGESLTPPPAAEGGSDDFGLGDLELGDSGNLAAAAGLSGSDSGGLDLGDDLLGVSGIDLSKSDAASGPSLDDDLLLGGGDVGDDLGGDDLGDLGATDESGDVDIDFTSTDELDVGGGGDDFDLNPPFAEEESASQVVELSSESGEGSFFENALDGTGSSFGEESGVENFASLQTMGGPTHAAAPEMNFSGLQIAGLIFMTLLMLVTVFLAYDVVRTIGSSVPVANPIVDAFAKIAGFRQ
jgi:excisionase family DNA binding protein